MAYLFDVFLLLILLCFVLIGRHKGFVRMLLEILRGVAAFIAAVWLGGKAAEILFDTFFKDKLYEAFQSAMEQGGSEELWEKLPQVVQRFAENNGITQEALQAQWSGASEQAAANAVELIRPALLQILAFILIFLLFILFWLLFNLLIRLIDKMFKLPMLNQVNRLIGGITGAVAGILAVLLICFAAESIAAFLPENASSFFEKSVGLSYIYSLTDRFV